MKKLADAIDVESSYRFIFKTLFLSTVPVALTNITMYLNESVVFHFLKLRGDSQMLGAYGLGASLMSVVSMAIFFGMNTGLTSRASQAFGAQNYRLVGLLFHRALLINMLIFIPCACIFYWSDVICIALKYEEQTSYYIQELLSLSIPAWFFLLIFHTLAAYLSACKIYTITASIKLMASILFWISTYITIDRLGMSMEGIAISYSIMHTFSILCLLTYIIFWKPTKNTWFWFCRDSFRELWSLFKYEALVGSMVYLEWIAYEMIYLFAGTLATVQYTALSIANANIGLVYAIPTSLADTVLSLLGNAVGERNEQKARRYLKAGVLFSIIILLIIELFYIFLSHWVIKFYVDDVPTINQAVEYLHVYILQMPGDFVQLILASGLRALGKENVGTLLMLVCFYGLGLPLAYTFCHVLGYEGVGLILGPLVNVYVILFGLIVIYCKLDWKKQVQIVADEVEREEEEMAKESRKNKRNGKRSKITPRDVESVFDQDLQVDRASSEVESKQILLN